MKNHRDQTESLKIQRNEPGNLLEVKFASWLPTLGFVTIFLPNVNSVGWLLVVE